VPEKLYCDGESLLTSTIVEANLVDAASIEDNKIVVESSPRFDAFFALRVTKLDMETELLESFSLKEESVPFLNQILSSESWL
jgi:hypothetical protein